MKKSLLFNIMDKIIKQIEKILLKERFYEKNLFEAPKQKFRIYLRLKKLRIGISLLQYC